MHTCVARLMHLCDVTHSYAWCDSFIYECDMTYAYVSHDSFICVTRLIHMCDVTHLYVRRDSFICVIRLISDRVAVAGRGRVEEEIPSYGPVRVSDYIDVTSHIWMSRATHMSESRTHMLEYIDVTSHLWMSRATLMSASHHTCQSI